MNADTDTLMLITNRLIAFLENGNHIAVIGLSLFEYDAQYKVLAAHGYDADSDYAYCVETLVSMGIAKHSTHLAQPVIVATRPRK